MIISEWVHTPSNIHVFPWNRKYKNVQDWFTKNWYIYANCNRIWVCFYFLSLWRCFSNPLGMSFLALAAATSLGSTTWGGGQAGAWGMLGSDFYAIGLQYHKHNIKWICDDDLWVGGGGQYQFTVCVKKEIAWCTSLRF